MTTSDIIFHHYPQSPVSEKVRIIFGMKGLTWRSVIVPRLPPRINQLPLTGGFRLTPVMQIGADIYCDTHCIIRELERRFPEPTLFPGGAHGMAWGVAQWTDGPLFKDVVTVALNYMIDSMPPEFIDDRGPLYFGSDFSIETLKASDAESRVAVRAQFGWMDERLSSRDFMLGDKPGLPDALCYYLVWFLMDRMPDDDPFFDQFPNLSEWEKRMRNIGHGNSTEMADTEALEIAKASSPLPATTVDPMDPMGYSADDNVVIHPSSGGPDVAGKIIALDANTVTLSREDTQVGTVHVHFPRIGYRIIKRTD